MTQPKTTSITEHQNHLEDRLKLVRDSGCPMFITTDGETVAVVLSPAQFEELTEQTELAKSREMVDRSIEDIKAGRTYPAKQAIEEIAQELGLTLERRPAHKR